MRKALSPIRIAILGYIWPEAISSAAGFRDENLLEAFLTAGFQVHYLSAAKASVFSEALEARGIKTHTIVLNHSSFDDLLKSLNLDFIIFDRFVCEEQYGARVEKASPQTIRIIDTQDLHCLRNFRQKNPLSPLEPMDLAQSQDFLRELSAIYRSDLSFILSTYEYDLLTNYYQVPEDILYYLPFCYDPPLLTTSPWEERKHFCFIGNYRHAPNYDGILWFWQHIWPIIHQELPQAELHLYGSYPPKEIMNLSGKNIFTHGPVQDHMAMLACYRVNIAPLRFGAGIKGKISDGWWAGTPCITTSIGAEGMNWHEFICDTPQGFAEAAIKIYSDKNLWTKLQASGYKILDEKFNKQKNFKSLIRKLLDLKENYSALRGKNHIGNMLRHHQSRSTEYFSRWLEEKCAPRSP